ncbi:MAG: TrkH family potassium uptake protein [Leptospiraceae bacterium]|nr:TrkH family potassium uptake protein [Leptospiraceae bacterium]
MSIRLVLAVQSILLWIFCAFLAIPATVAWLIYPYENRSDAFIITLAINLAIAGVFRLLGGSLRGREIGLRESFVIVGLSWILIAFVGALPFYISGAIPSLADAYFESMSGFTTTGASILQDIEGMGKSLLFWRSFTHFIGGGGIIVLTVAILPALNVGGVTLFEREASTPFGQKMIPKIKQIARQIWVIYLGLNVLAILMLHLGGMNWFESITHAIGAIATGGFSPLNKSIGHYAATGHPSAFYFEMVLVMFMLLGSMSFVLIFSLMRGQLRVAANDAQLRFYLGVIVISILVVTLNLTIQENHGNYLKSLRSAVFSVVSVASTTGYGTDDFAIWPLLSKFILVFLMFMGGCTGSTAAGMKAFRVSTALKEFLTEIYLTVHPRQVKAIHFGGHYLSLSNVRAINTFLLTYVFCYAIGVSLLAWLEPDFETVASSVVACISTIGPGSSAINGPAGNYSSFHPASKIILSFLMLLGRLEIFPVLVLFLPSTWSKN